MKDMIDARELSLSEWLELLEKHHEGDFFPAHCFPSDKAHNDYIESITDRSYEDVYKLLHQFLMPSGSLGVDGSRLVHIKERLQNHPDPYTALLNRPYYLRL